MNKPHLTPAAFADSFTTAVVGNTNADRSGGKKGTGLISVTGANQQKAGSKSTQLFKIVGLISGEIRLTGWEMMFSIMLPTSSLLRKYQNKFIFI